MSGLLRYLRYDYYFGDNCETCFNKLKNALNTGEQLNIQEIIYLANKTNEKCNIPQLHFFLNCLENTYKAYLNDMQHISKWDVIASKYELRAFVDLQNSQGKNS
jgi:hypothetical protein